MRSRWDADRDIFPVDTWSISGATGCLGRTGASPPLDDGSALDSLLRGGSTGVTVSLPPRVPGPFQGPSGNSSDGIFVQAGPCHRPWLRSSAATDSTQRGIFKTKTSTAFLPSGQTEASGQHREGQRGTLGELASLLGRAHHHLQSRETP